MNINKKGRINDGTPHKIVTMLEILIEILSRLPAISLSRFKFVSKHWYSLITNDPILPNLHLDRGFKNSNPSIIIKSRVRRLILMDDQGGHMRHVYGTDKDLGGVSSSCNGLLCIYHEAKKPILFNPTTGEELALPPPMTKSRNTDFAVFTIGYLPTTKEYKLVRFFDSPKKCEVLTLGSGSSGWREISVGFELGPFTTYRGICINGFLYWSIHSMDSTAEIFSFDLHNEKFERVVFPWSLDVLDGVCLLELENCLCVAVFEVEAEAEAVEIWMLENVTSHSWVKIHQGKIHCPSSLKAILIHQGKIIVQSYEGLQYCDLKTGCTNIGKIYEDRWYQYTAQVHKESLVSLKAL